MKTMTIAAAMALAGSMALAGVTELAPKDAGSTAKGQPVTLVPGMTPGPKGAPASSPNPVATGLPAPSLAGLAPVGSGIDLAAYLTKSWGTGAIALPEPSGLEGAFRFLCAPSHNAYDDPIVYPGQPGKSHLHTFFGNTGAGASSTYQSLRTSGDSTCNNLLNRSAYWVPAMMNGRGKVVMPDWVQIYYKREPSNSPVCTFAGKACVPLPRGLRYVFGFNMANPAASSPIGDRWFNCDGPGAVSGKFASIAEAARGCPVGARLGMILNAPSCWNGTQLDSADHRSHMAYMYYDGNAKQRCPATHPYVLPRFTLGAWYTTDGSLDRSGNRSTDAKTWYLSSDRMPGMPNATPGTTLHADWFGAWDDTIMALWMANCVNRVLSCSGGDLGNGLQMKTLAGYGYPNKTQLVDPPKS